MFRFLLARCRIAAPALDCCVLDVETVVQRVLEAKTGRLPIRRIFPLTSSAAYEP